MKLGFKRHLADLFPTSVARLDAVHHAILHCRMPLRSLLHTTDMPLKSSPYQEASSTPSLPDTKPPLNPPPPNTILPNIIPRILDILLALQLSLPHPLQPILLPLLDLLGLLQPLLLVLLRRLLHMHLVDLNESRRGFEGVAQEIFARGKQVAEDGLGDKVHVPCCYGEGDEYALWGERG